MFEIENTNNGTQKKKKFIVDLKNLFDIEVEVDKNLFKTQKKARSKDYKRKDRKSCEICKERETSKKCEFCSEFVGG